MSKNKGNQMKDMRVKGSKRRPTFGRVAQDKSI